jgi:hypothetical protein
MASFLCRLWGEKEGQDIAEYAGGSPSEDCQTITHAP